MIQCFFGSIFLGYVFPNFAITWRTWTRALLASVFTDIRCWNSPLFSSLLWSCPFSPIFPQHPQTRPGILIQAVSASQMLPQSSYNGTLMGAQISLSKHISKASLINRAVLTPKISHTKLRGKAALESARWLSFFSFRILIHLILTSGCSRSFLRGRCKQLDLAELVSSDHISTSFSTLNSFNPMDRSHLLR